VRNTATHPMDLREQTDNPHRHPWELSRADMVLRLLSKNPRRTRYADVGAGDLYFARRLRSLTDSTIYAVDVNYGSSRAEEQLEVCTDLTQVPPASVDWVLLMDVLEHVEDDLGLLNAVTRIQAPDGHLLATVPAHPFLWSEHDVVLGHHRRYNRARLCDVLQRGGFHVDECFYCYGLPFLARAWSVGLAALGLGRNNGSAVSLWRYPDTHPATRTVRAMLNGDFRLSRLLGPALLPWSGLSICAICRRASV
jgi:SAM-dependent methyltransferase